MSITDTIKKIDWYADWSGPFSMLEVSMTPQVYTDVLRYLFKTSFSRFLVIYHNGVAFSRLPHNEFERVGKNLAEKIKNTAFAKSFAENFKNAADKVMPKVKLSPEKFLNQITSYKTPYQIYGGYNVATKIAFNFLPKNTVKQKNLLEDARLYSETFYKDNSEIFSKVADIISTKAKYPKELILMTSYNELSLYLKNGKIPDASVLKQRYECSGLYFDGKKLTILSKKDVEEIEKSWLKDVLKTEITGKTAFPGKVKGTCRLVLDYKKAQVNDGEVLVTGMTDPNFVPLMKKVSAIITDGGGLLSHAAIVARELKKPCIIGTKIATKVLKDGDAVEVDADKGIVKILR